MAGIICPKSSDADNVLLPLNSNLENPNPASKETIRVNTVAAKATTRLLAKDLGMEVSNKTRAKFEKVGVSVKNLGGDMNNSDAGFMEDKNIHIAGKSAARQQIARNTQALRMHIGLYLFHESLSLLITYLLYNSAITAVTANNTEAAALAVPKL